MTRRRFRSFAAPVVALIAAVMAIVARPASGGPTPTPVRMGFQAGDDWEPAIAADRFNHVYVLWTHYGDDPLCPSCASPHMELQVSSDGGATWSQSRPLKPSSVRQDDPQIVVDPVDGKTLYAAFMEGNKASMLVTKSTDFGSTWKTMLVEPLQRGTDKDILAVRGQNVYLAYNAVQKIYVSASHDGGKTWVNQQVQSGSAHLGWSLPGGGGVDSNGRVYFAWDGYTQNGGAKGPVYLYISKSTDGGATWTTSLLDVSEAPQPCAGCGWAYWGAQGVVAVDGSNRVYALWNANDAKFGPNRVQFSRSTNAGSTWSSPVDVSASPVGSNNLFPAIAARGNGDVRIAWMDDRNGRDDGTNSPDARWNVYYRTSTNAGSSWSSESQVSKYVAGYSYKFATPLDGYLEPYGDYFEMDIDSAGKTHLTWGEGPSYAGPGNVWYSGF
jgi:BNR repeat protein